MVNWTKGNHKIIFGTPRSGTTFVALWYSNKFSGYQHLSKNKGFEHFDPSFMDCKSTDRKLVNLETKRRISQDLKKLSIFKIHPGKNYSKHIYDYLKNEPIIVVKRKDVLGQFLSWGIGWQTNKWAHFKIESKKDITTLNGLVEGQKFEYSKLHFEELKYRIDKFTKIEKTLKNIDRIIWFEDLPKWNIAGDTTVRQNPQSNEEKLNLLTNKHEFLDWYNNFKNSNKK